LSTGREPASGENRRPRLELPAFTEWKNPARGFYVLGLEPGTVVPLGRGPCGTQ